jgi:formiminotetrahydrofolate cyclodeaminase
VTSAELPALLDCTVADFLELLAAKQPAPGGGAVAATTVAMAAGLLGMAARYSAAQLIDSPARAAHADQDAAAYQAVLAAFALPREPDPQVRCRQIRSTLKRAARIPMEIAETASVITIEAVELIKRGNRNLRGDAFTAATLAAAAARAAAELVRLNVELGSLTSELAERATRAAQAAAEAITVLNRPEDP